jgi:hypothetical protein
MVMIVRRMAGSNSEFSRVADFDATFDRPNLNVVSGNNLDISRRNYVDVPAAGRGPVNASSVVPRFQPRQLPGNSSQPLLNARVNAPKCAEKAASSTNSCIDASN